MKNDKVIRGQIVRKNGEHKGAWDILETRGGRLTGKALFTGTLKEVRLALRHCGGRAASGPAGGRINSDAGAGPTPDGSAPRAPGF